MSVEVCLQLILVDASPICGVQFDDLHNAKVSRDIRCMRPTEYAPRQTSVF